ncbi:MAG: MFS transporter [Anaerolineae bacterium]
MTTSVSYSGLLRQNTAFRRLWYGQIVSELGDWFDSIALFSLLLRLTGSAQAVAIVLVCQGVPQTLIGPFAGVVVDRLPRKTVMVAADLLRIPIVLLLLLVRSPDMVWLAYVAVFLKFSVTSFFEPARSAFVPSVVSEEELVVANTLSGATWSVMLALGAALGGIVAGLLGSDASFILDALSFLGSALIIMSIHAHESHTALARTTSGWQEFREGLRFLNDHRRAAVYTFSKAIWGMTSGIALVCTLMGNEIFPIGVGGAITIGLMYGARGVGAAIGPVIAERIGNPSRSYLRRGLGPACLVGAAGYLGASFAPILPLALLGIGCGAMGSSTQWVFSTTLVQVNVPNRLLGRIFSIENASFTLSFAMSSFLVGYAHDQGAAPRSLMMALACVGAAVGLLFMALLRTPDEAETLADGMAGFVADSDL